MTKTMVLVNGVWTEKPVMFGYPNWRTLTPPAPAWPGVGMTKRNAQIIAAGSGSVQISSWSAMAEYPATPTITNSRLLVPTTITPGQYRVRAVVNSYLTGNPDDRGGFYVDKLASGVTSIVIDQPGSTSGGNRPEVSVTISLSGGETFGVWAYKSFVDLRVDATYPNYLIVEPV